MKMHREIKGTRKKFCQHPRTFEASSNINVTGRSRDRQLGGAVPTKRYGRDDCNRSV